MVFFYQLSQNNLTYKLKLFASNNTKAFYSSNKYNCFYLTNKNQYINISINSNSYNSSYNLSTKDSKTTNFKRLEIIKLLSKQKTPNTSNLLIKKQTALSEKSNDNKFKNPHNELIVSNKNESYVFKYSRLNEYKKLGVELASPDKIRKWAERLLPTGKVVGMVLNANTLHHKTLKPLKGGLFCERIFGPTKDFRCACGKTIAKRNRKQSSIYSSGFVNILNPTNKPIKRFFCKICEVEYTWALTRRYQLGYIPLAFPVTHLWYTKGFSSPISILFDIHKYDLDHIIYCSQTTSIEKSYEITEMGISLRASTIFDSLKYNSDKKLLNNKPSNKDYLKLSDISPNLISSLKKHNNSLKNINILDLITNKNLQMKSVLIPSDIKQKKGKMSDRKNNLLIIRQNKILSNYSSQNKINDNNIIPVQSEQIKINLITSSENELIESFIVPVIAIYSIKFFAPFISWLLNYLVQSFEYNNIINEQNNNLITTAFFNDLFGYLDFNEQNKSIIRNNKKQNSNITSNDQKKYFSQLKIIENNNNIQILVTKLFNFKQQFKTSLTLVNQLPSILERRYHKYLILMRQNLYKLPTKTLNKINQRLYEESYYITKKRTKKFVSLFKLSSSLLKSQSGLNEQSNSHLILNNSENFTVTKETNQYTNRLSYFLKQLKNSLNPLNTLQHSFDLNEIAVHFILNRLKKTNIFLSKQRKQTLNNKYKNLNIWNLSYDMSDSSNLLSLNNVKVSEIKDIHKKPSVEISFYYNLYSIADDHLWDNIYVWIILKSYITITPDVMDKPIPAYSHRIPVSGLTELIDIRPKKQNSLNIQKYLNNYKKYLCFELDLLSTKNKISYKVDIFNRTSLLKQALPIKSTGAGIINKLLKSITSSELIAMDKQFSILLRDSRKMILSYKTRISTTSPNYDYKSLNNYIKPLSDIYYLKNSLYIKKTNDIKEIITKTQEIQTHTKLSISKNRFITPLNDNLGVNSRSDRYYGIDKWMEKHHELLRRSKIIRKFSNTNLLPKSMILNVLPVLPPDLRPIMKMADQIATSDLNRLYQRVLYRNERLNKIVLQLSESNLLGISNSLYKTGSTNLFNENDNLLGSLDSKYNIVPKETPLFGYEKHYAQRLLQEAVDNLIDNGRSGGNTEKDAKGRTLKSLSEVLKGKQGRFRQYLLGKRVDYSGRSVIVVGPKLKIHQCGLPREMAIELYLPFIIQYLIQMKYTKTVVGAKTLIAHNKTFIESILDNVVRGHPIILNRAPTLHRLGFQAFQPILVDGRAILLHPMACTAFNADFDGDQMAVHIPITIEARSEAWRLMLARNNLLSPATGEPIILPSQDMVLGCYYLTTTRKLKHSQYEKSNLYFSDIDTILSLYYMGQLHVHSPIWLKTEKIVLTDSIKKPIEVRMDSSGKIQEIYSNTELYYDIDGKLIHQYIRTTPGRILFNLILKNS